MERPRRNSGRGVCQLSAAAAVLLGALDAGFAAGHGHTVADRYGYAQLLLKGQRAAGAAAVGAAGDAGAALAGHRGRPHDGGGVQGQGCGDIHALGRHFIAAAGNTVLLRRTGLERHALAGFIDTQRNSLISWRLWRLRRNRPAGGLSQRLHISGSSRIHSILCRRSCPRPPRPGRKNLYRFSHSVL